MCVGFNRTINSAQCSFGPFVGRVVLRVKRRTSPGLPEREESEEGTYIDGKIREAKKRDHPHKKASRWRNKHAGSNRENHGSTEFEFSSGAFA